MYEKFAITRPLTDDVLSPISAGLPIINLRFMGRDWDDIGESAQSRVKFRHLG